MDSSFGLLSTVFVALGLWQKEWGGGDKPELLTLWWSGRRERRGRGEGREEEEERGRNKEGEMGREGWEKGEERIYPQ